MNRRKLFRLMIPVVAVASLAMTSCAGTPGNDASGTPGKTVTIHIPLTKDISSLDVLVAKDQGYFESRGLDVQVEFVNDSSNLPQVTGRQYEITGVSAATLINSVASGLSLVAVTGNRVDTPENPTAGIVVPAGSPITSVGDLAGKTVGTPSVAGTLAFATQYGISQAGGDYASMRLVQAPAPQLVDLLKAGRFDAVLALEPARTALVNAGFVDVGDPFRALGDSVASAINISTPEWVQANPEALASFRAALADADEYIAHNPDKAKELLVSEAGLDKDGVAALKVPQFVSELPDGTMSMWVDVMKEVGVLTADVDVDALTAK